MGASLEAGAMGVGLETGSLGTSLVLGWAGSLHPWEPTWSLGLLV